MQVEGLHIRAQSRGGLGFDGITATRLLRGVRVRVAATAQVLLLLLMLLLLLLLMLLVVQLLLRLVSLRAALAIVVHRGAMLNQDIQALRRQYEGYMLNMLFYFLKITFSKIETHLNLLIFCGIVDG